MSKAITRAMADDAAKKIAAKAYNKKVEIALEKLKKAVGEAVYAVYPKPLVALANEYPAFFKFHSSVRICYEGHYSTDFPAPDNTLDCYNSYNGVLVSIEVYGKLAKLRNAYKHLTNQRESYEHKVSDALVQLKSKKNVEANFPEALEFLDFGSANVPAVRCEDLRKILYS